MPDEIDRRVSQCSRRELARLLCMYSILVNVVRWNKTGIARALLGVRNGDCRARLLLKPLQRRRGFGAHLGFKACGRKGGKQTRRMRWPFGFTSISKVPGIRLAHKILNFESKHFEFLRELCLASFLSSRRLIAELDQLQKLVCRCQFDRSGVPL